MTLREKLRDLGLGRAALRYWHAPIGRVRQSLRNGGPLAERETERQRREMEVAASHLGALPTFPGSRPVAVHLMTGRRFWYQTLFCLHSLARASRVPLAVELYDDGSIDERCVEILRSLGPGVVVHSFAQLSEKLERQLPIARFPVLRERWVKYPHIRKLTDVHAGSSGWKLVLDSDMLFHRRPDRLLQWLAAPNCLLHAVDCAESYGYSRPLLDEVAGVALPAMVNVGVCGIRSDSIDWDQLEYWTRELQARENTNYFLEQALVAMLAARQPSEALSAADYITNPTKDECMTPGGVMHHYVAASKRWYFRHGWRHVIQ